MKNDHCIKLKEGTILYTRDEQIWMYHAKEHYLD